MAKKIKKNDKRKPELLGWDDGKLYFYDEEGKEHCVNDYPKVFERITKICVKYFKNTGDVKRRIKQ